MRTLIVDDNAGFLDASRAMLERDGLTVVGAAMTATEALARAQELKPDLILVDIDLGQDSGFALTSQLVDQVDTSAAPAPNVILVSAHPQEDFAELVEESEALGFIPKSELSVEAIQQLLARRG